MADHAAKPADSASRRDLEMSDVRLLDADDEDDFMAFGQSDLTSVLANPDFARRRCARTVSTSCGLSHANMQDFTIAILCVCRPWNRFLNFLQERPHPLFNIPAAGLMDPALHL